MREILFRGKRLDNGEWVEGNLITYRGLCYIHPENEYFMFDMGKGSWNLHYLVDFHVCLDTVGQFTGLLDKNGKRIFEGDILRCCLGDKIDIGVVQYDDRIAAFIVLFTDGVLTFLDFFTAKVETWYEVIGNIHDNPDLLEVTPDE